MTDRSPRQAWICGVALAACLVISLAAVLYPIYVIRPFRAQGARELAVSLAVMRWRGALTVASALAAIVALALYWQTPQRWWRRALAAAGALTVVALAFAARVNVYELMFHPAGAPAFTAADAARLDADENVLAVHFQRESRAYPVRSLAYHHIVNDVVEDRAVVATY